MNYKHMVRNSGALSVLLLMLISLGEAQFKVSDNFNRPDGDPGLGWTAWGNGAKISSSQLETFGETDVAGGIERKLDVTFPVNFSFNFSTSVPSLGGWLIGFNAAGVNVVVVNDTSEVELRQYYGTAPLCIVFQTSAGPSAQCGNTVSGQRDYTANALVSGIVNADFSAKVTIKYNDGLLPASVTLLMPAPAGALQQPNGSVFFFGNSSLAYGPHFFDNFKLTLP